MQRLRESSHSIQATCMDSRVAIVFNMQRIPVSHAARVHAIGGGPLHQGAEQPSYLGITCFQVAPDGVHSQQHRNKSHNTLWVSAATPKHVICALCRHLVRPNSIKANNRSCMLWRISTGEMILTDRGLKIF